MMNPSGSSERGERAELTIRDVCGIVGVSRYTIYEWIKKSGFPAAVQYGPKTHRWHKTAVHNWMRAREAAE